MSTGSIENPKEHNDVVGDIRNSSCRNGVEMTGESNGSKKQTSINPHYTRYSQETDLTGGQSRSYTNEDEDFTTQVPHPIVYRMPGPDIFASFTLRSEVMEATAPPSTVNNLPRTFTSPGGTLRSVNLQELETRTDHLTNSYSAHPISTQPSWPTAKSLSAPQVELLQYWAPADIVFEDGNDDVTRDHLNNSRSDASQPLLSTITTLKKPQRLLRARKLEPSTKLPGNRDAWWEAESSPKKV
ncbi:hypothetical protein BU25DRAFT_407610 [Macroventuria anomochaeta]|uniref:Uncharacterized protein n=1 Tax=Macroventuria anomochaeta TaxID=301207 RepID=A0ACB6SD69_9PLEO|nr:uncharacterized protein BU25DRAFT_407610 [Macroventuria anomochaeta]KAF2631042.1 hypothetical protein BU25DRAFT_407610 [Macroventuria anomochaeta]